MADDDQIDGSFFGQTFKLQGPHTIYLLITGGLAVVVGMMLWQTTQNMKLDLIHTAAEISKQHEAIAIQHQTLNNSMLSLNETMQEQNYIITLDNAKREKLNLSMPRTLREKTERRN